MTDIVGLHAIFGAFLVGPIVPHEGGSAVALSRRSKTSSPSSFSYFALCGLKTNLGSLNEGIVWSYTVGIIAVAFVSKFVACATLASSPLASLSRL